MLLRAPHTHLYPGLRLRVVAEDAGPPTPAAGERRCVVEFVDGAAARAALRDDPDGPVLVAEPHLTAAGTRVAARRWRLAQDGDAGGAGGFVVVRRLP